MSAIKMIRMEDRLWKEILLSRTIQQLHSPIFLRIFQQPGEQKIVSLSSPKKEGEESTGKLGKITLKQQGQDDENTMYTSQDKQLSENQFNFRNIANQSSIKDEIGHLRNQVGRISPGKNKMTKPMSIANLRSLIKNLNDQPRQNPEKSQQFLSQPKVENKSQESSPRSQLSQPKKIIQTQDISVEKSPLRKIGGGFSLFKTVAMIRRNKILPMKKMSKEQIQKLFRKSYISVLAIIRLNKVCEDIRNYGTSPSLFDVAVRNRQVVQKMLFPLSNSDAHSKKDDKNTLEFPLIDPSSSFLKIWNPILVTY